MTEISVTRKGQITIPADIRRKFNVEEGMKVEVIEEEGKIVIRRVASIFDLAGSGSGKGLVSELKSALDEMRVPQRSVYDSRFFVEYFYSDDEGAL